jgi:chromosome segregation ATPase
MTQRADSSPPVTAVAADSAGRQKSIAYLEGQLDVLRTQFAGLEAADEHHRAELAAARADAAEAQATLREAQSRLEDRRQLIEDLRTRLDAAQSAQARAEQERTAVIEALGRRAKRRLSQGRSESRAV